MMGHHSSICMGHRRWHRRLVLEHLATHAAADTHRLQARNKRRRVHWEIWKQAGPHHGSGQHEALQCAGLRHATPNCLQDRGQAGVLIRKILPAQHLWALVRALLGKALTCALLSSCCDEAHRTSNPHTSQTVLCKAHSDTPSIPSYVYRYCYSGIGEQSVQLQ